MGEPKTTGPPKVPASVLCTESTIVELKLKINSTPDIGGNVLGIVKPVWQKALESEVRTSWLRKMLERDLVLRDILKFGQIIEEKMRAESSREGEIGREALIQIMRIKLMDEMRFYRESKRIRETIRDYIRRKFGRRRYNSIIEKIKQAMEKRKTELEEKYKNKIEHLAALREQEKRDKLEIIPAGLESLS